MGLDAAAFHDEDEEEPPKVGLSDSELERIRKKQARAQRRRARKDALVKTSGRKEQSGLPPSSLPSLGAGPSPCVGTPSPGAVAPSPSAGAPSPGAGAPFAGIGPFLGVGAPSPGVPPSARASPPASFPPLSTLSIPSHVQRSAFI